MTREEAIARIENHKILHKMNEPRAIYISEALDMAIKALEQESALDKISVEIKHFMHDINPSSSESDYVCNYILQIINKYKAESDEPQESEE